MEIELLVVPDCPSTAAARAALRAAAAGIEGLSTTVTVVTTDEEAQRRGFRGSPTYLIDGIDPVADPQAPPGLTCRLSGVPDVAALRDALLAALASRPDR